MATTDASKATQVYQIFIKAPPEAIWEAITTTEFRRLYFHGSSIESSFEPGSSVLSHSPDGTELWGEDTVLECNPPHRLSQTWGSLYDPELAVEPKSRITWDIEPQGDGSYCKVTVTHDQLEGSPKTADRVSGGWLLIVSGLKTVVETGHALT